MLRSDSGRSKLKSNVGEFMWTDSEPLGFDGVSWPTGAIVGLKGEALSREVILPRPWLEGDGLTVL